MPTVKAGGEEIVRVSVRGGALDDLLSKEWLLTNGRGGYAASTVIGCNTSGYHALLVGSLTPPVNRIMALSNCLETVVCGGKVFQLSTFEFPDRHLPAGYTHLHEFWRDTGAHFLYRLDSVEVHKAIYLAYDSDTVLVEYEFHNVNEPVEFLLRPFVALRDFHTLQKSHARMYCEALGSGVQVRQDEGPPGQLFLACPEMQFETDSQWWYNFTYRVNRHRGLHYTEDLWTPGVFRGRVGPVNRMAFWARFDATRGEGVSLLWDPGLPKAQAQNPLGADQALMPDADQLKRDLAGRQEKLIHLADAESRIDRLLTLAADQFIVTRTGAKNRRDTNDEIRDTRYEATILAGYPWFMDWGRDAFIALPGLLLATGRHEEARSILKTFAAAADGGMIPNRFDDRTHEVHFNSVDASLWFIHAAFEYLDATGDLDTFSRDLLPVIGWIIDSYHSGTRFGIHADSDGLIVAGDSGTQLTWMDAMCDGIAFTPRHGKAVEINALWHHVLCRMAQFHSRLSQATEVQRTDEIRTPRYAIQPSPRATDYGRMAEQVGESFIRVFWNADLGYLNDTVLPDGTVDSSLRPNQIFAVSLACGPPLIRQQQWAVVVAMEGELLTPYGLRTLNRRHPCYQGRYEGSPRQRDEAYHQGTVWPWLIGPFVEAWLRVHDFTPASRNAAARMLEPLTNHLTETGCLGSISEIFDADPPHRPAGCPAQAWSVAELMRVLRLLSDKTPRV